MGELTTYERMRRIYEHREADRVPITDWFWESTAARWRKEGLPAGCDLEEYFGLDLIPTLEIEDLDTSPRFEHIIIEETDTYRIERNAWGVTTKNFKPVSSTPQDLHFEIKDPESWRRAKERMAPTPDRINWAKLRTHYKSWRAQGAWIMVAPWFGFDIANTRMVGTERTMLALAEEPEWCRDMFNSQLDLTLALLQMIWDAGYTFDEFLWFDDMAYRNGLFFSPRTYRELIKPYHQRVIGWAHARGIKAHLHCCGNVNALVPELVDMGLDAFNPIEVKADMDPFALKRTYGDRLVLRGGFDVRNWNQPDKVEEDIRRVLPVMKAGGGYIFACDHSVPDSVSMENYRHIVRLAKEVGAY